MAATEKPGTWEEWKAKHPQWHQLLVLELICIAGLCIGLIALRGADGWSFWSENRESLRDLLLALAAPVAFITAGAALLQARIAANRHVEQTKADRERRITDSFIKAVELLASDKLEANLGAVYALERIAHESMDDHWPIMETLAAYLRAKLPHLETVKVPPEPDANQPSESMPPDPADADKEPEVKIILPAVKSLPANLEAVLTVFARRERKYDPKGLQINLSEANLGLTNLNSANLSEVNLHLANLSGASLYSVNLSKTDLHLANLSGGYLIEANLTNANLIGANLIGARLSSANLSGADLTLAQLNRANLIHADLSEASLVGANLSEADLKKANLNLSKGHLFGADLFGADLSGAKLNEDNLEDTKLCKTIMPNGTMNNRDCPEPTPPDPSEPPPAPN
jgi:uncharacterized protein YjbI with pentapeptide repeats